MNDLEKAQELIKNRNYSLSTLSKELGISLDSLNRYRKQPEKLADAKWRRVNRLANYYEEKRKDNDSSGTNATVEYLPLRKLGDSYSVIFPKSIAEKAGITAENNEMAATTSDGKIVLRPRTEAKLLEKLFRDEGYTVETPYPYAPEKQE